jgi:hypothetical protein
MTFDQAILHQLITLQMIESSIDFDSAAAFDEAAQEDFLQKAKLSHIVAASSLHGLRGVRYSAAFSVATAQRDV